MTRVGIIASLLVLAAACGAPGTATPDAGGDGGAGGAGLTLAFSIDPAVPGPIEDGFTIDSVDLAIKDLRLTGDAASASDDRTRAAYLAISWKQGKAPYPATFPMAPPGLYSKIAFKLENDTGDAFHLKGTIMFEGFSRPWDIEDEDGLGVDVPMNLMLPAGGSATDTLQVHLREVMQSIDWTKATLGLDGTLRIESDTQLQSLRTAIAGSFTAASASTAPH